MRVSYKNSFFDIFLFCFLHHFLSLTVQAFYLLFCVLIFLTGTVDAEGKLFSAISVAVIFYLIMWIIEIIFFIIYIAATKHPSWIAEHTVEVSDEACYDETTFSKSFYYWKGILKLVCRPGFIAIYVQPHLALIVPNRAFSSTEGRSQFIAAVKNQMNLAKQRAQVTY